METLDIPEAILETKRAYESAWSAGLKARTKREMKECAAKIARALNAHTDAIFDHVGHDQAKYNMIKDALIVITRAKPVATHPKG